MLKYQMLMEKIKDQIQQGDFKEGEGLPAIRSIAKEYSCNKSTVIRALDQLRQENLIYAIPGSGYYIMPTGKKDVGTIDFTLVKPEDNLIPFHEFNHCLQKSMEYYRDELFTYNNPQGLISLREVIKKDLEDNQVFTAASRLCITNGAQQALDILMSLFNRDRAFALLVEEPTYNLIFQMAKEKGVSLITLPRDKGGIDLQQLNEILLHQQVDAFYVNTRLQNPMGTTHSEKTKQGILQLAHEYGIKIIEDDCLVDLDTNRASLPLHYYDIHHTVIYIKSYSKCFVPGIRLGVVALTQDVVDDFIQLKRLRDLGSSVINQGALEFFIKSGLYKRHRQKLQKVYGNRMKWATELLINYGKELIECTPSEAGIFIWLRVLVPVDMKLLIRELEKENIMVSAGKEFYEDGEKGCYHLRLCIYNLPDERLRQGLIMLLKTIQRLKN